MLMRWALVVALMVGLCMSLAQILYAVAQTRTAISTEADQILAMFETPASEAQQSRDVERATRVINGLFRHESLRAAVLGRPDRLPLAERFRPLQPFPFRYLTDRLFAAEQRFSLPLHASHQVRPIGELTIVLDTAVFARKFLDDALLYMLGTIVWALLLAVVLFFVYRVHIRRPLLQLVEDISAVDPEYPGRHQLDIDAAHKHNELGLWVERINHLLRAIEHSNQLRHEAEENLLRMSHVDFLTGLPNRQGLQNKLDSILSRAESGEHMVAVMCIGLDGFKSINERYSFQLGDWLLRSFSQRVSSQLSGELASFARLGGDQFILVQDNLGHSYQAAVLAQKILFLLQQPFTIPRHGEEEEITLRLGATIGITLFPGDAETSELLLQKAEQTMQLTKLGSRNRYQFYIASIDNQLRERRLLEEDLRAAIDNNELHLLYQPQIDYRTGKIVGAEALLRWKRKGKVLVPPDVFIPVAEQNGTILSIGEWVLERACEQAREWLDIGWRDFRIAVNLSAVQLHHDGLGRLVERVIQTYNIPPDCLEFEVTETSLMQNVDAARAHLLELRKLGVGIAIDDFGTGHSSLAYLKQLPLDKIKIDRSFVQDVVKNEGDATIVRTVIQLSHSLKLKVLAEGVETTEHEEALVSMGCDEGQGYLYSKPITPDALLDQYGRFSD